MEAEEKRKQVETVQGVVEHAVQNTNTRYGVRIGGVWYNGFGRLPVRKGDLVAVDFVNHDGYANIENIEEAGFAGEPAAAATSRGAAQAQAPDDRDGRITRAVALKCAVVLWSRSRRQDIESRTLESARLFEAWLSGVELEGGD
jgi:hypothetical protein